ncbi:hypothetical protein BH11PSE9_BH11PSE9_13530 [soil metagenome]
MPIASPPGDTVFRVLLADDNRDVADNMAELIELSMPCQTVVVYDGAEAIDRALAARPDAVLLDLQMPGRDGIEVAQAITERWPDNPPYLIAMTGRHDAVHDLPAIDQLFDRVLAKPLDADGLIATLAAVAARTIGAARASRSFDLAELFTRVVRLVVPLAAAKKLAFSFDWRGASLMVEDDPVEVECGLHRLLLGAVESVSSGFVMFSADAQADASGQWSVTFDAAGSGTLQDKASLAQVLARLALTESNPSPDSGLAIHEAHGVCPNTGAAIAYSSDAREGVLLRMCLACPSAVESPASPAPQVPGLHAWVIDENAQTAAWAHRPLQRLGWVVTRFSSCELAIFRAHGLGQHGTALEPLPSLVIVVEAPTSKAPSLAALVAALPADTQRVVAVMAGSPALGAPERWAAFDLRVFPLSPMEISDFGRVALASSSSRPTIPPMPEAADDRPTVLIVDDNELNRIVGRGLVEALGYEVRTAHDGLDAIDQCRRLPPHVVLMDLNMPVLPGIEATRRIRELQRLGEIAPFAVIAATADDSPEARQASLAAGMDGFMTKPIDLRVLREQLRRFTAFRRLGES